MPLSCEFGMQSAKKMNHIVKVGNSLIDMNELAALDSTGTAILKSGEKIILDEESATALRNYFPELETAAKHS